MKQILQRGESTDTRKANPRPKSRFVEQKRLFAKDLNAHSFQVSRSRHIIKARSDL